MIRVSKTVRCALSLGPGEFIEPPKGPSSSSKIEVWMVLCVTWGSIVSVDADAICIVFECCWFKRWSYLPSPLGISQQLGTELLGWGARMAQPATCLAIGRSAKPTSATNRRAAAACGPSPSKRPFSAPVPWRWAKASVTSRSSWDLGHEKNAAKNSTWNQRWRWEHAEDASFIGDF